MADYHDTFVTGDDPAYSVVPPLLAVETVGARERIREAFFALTRLAFRGDTDTDSYPRQLRQRDKALRDLDALVGALERAEQRAQQWDQRAWAERSDRFDAVARAERAEQALREIARRGEREAGRLDCSALAAMARYVLAGSEVES